MEEKPRQRRLVRTAYVLAHRLRCLSWWAGVMERYPGGVVPMDTAARILGVNRSRVDALVREGRLPIVEGMPGGKRADRFVPLAALLGAPSPLHVGKQWGWHFGHPNGGAESVRCNPWGQWAKEAQYLEKSEQLTEKAMEEYKDRVAKHLRRQYKRRAELDR